jgi:hypothetical protein
MNRIRRVPAGQGQPSPDLLGASSQRTAPCPVTRNSAGAGQAPVAAARALARCDHRRTGPRAPSAPPGRPVPAHQEVTMNPIRAVRRSAGILAWLASVLLASADAAPAALASPLRPDPPWWLTHRACRCTCHPSSGLLQALATAAPRSCSRCPGRRHAGLADHPHHGRRRCPRCRGHPARTGAGSQAAPDHSGQSGHRGA